MSHSNQNIKYHTFIVSPIAPPKGASLDFYPSTSRISHYWYDYTHNDLYVRISDSWRSSYHSRNLNLLITTSLVAMLEIMAMDTSKISKFI